MRTPAAIVFALFTCLVSVRPCFANELPQRDARSEAQAEGASPVESLLEGALGLVGIRYRRGGNNPEAGFDCSGFVGHVFREYLGLALPRTSHEISRAGLPISSADLKAGDLVFFNTMRNAFSHVGIYLGNNRFVHSPRPGRAVRVEDMQDNYWARRYDGARRINGA